MKTRANSDEGKQAVGRIEQAIKQYRVLRSNAETQPTPREQRIALADAERAGRKFLGNLQALDPLACERVARQDPKLDDQLREMVMAPFVTMFGIAPVKLAIDSVKPLLDQLARAREGIPKRRDRQRRSVRNRPLPHLVDQIATVFAERTGEPLSRSYKSASTNFVKMVLGLAEPKIGPGQIDEAAERAIRRRQNSAR